MIFTVVALISFTSIFAANWTEEGNTSESRGCRHWYIKIFDYQILDHANDECGGDNWNWF